MKNFLLKFFVQLFQKRRPKHPIQNRILIVSTTALGDTLWATPAIENIKTTFPNCYLAALTSPIGSEVLKNNPHLAKIFIFPKRIFFSFFKNVKQLYKEKFDTVLIFHTSQRLALPLVSLIGATKIIGTAHINKGLDCLLTEKLQQKYIHEIIRRNEIASKIGAKTEITSMSYYFEEEENPLLKKETLLIALHPGSKDPYKRWPKEKFIELGKKLKSSFNCDILITGTLQEKDLLEQIASQIQDSKIQDLKKGLREFAKELKNIDLLIANDTGPVHLSIAIQTPVIAIYSPTDPKLCGPLNADHAKVISRKPTCSPCLKRKCHRSFCFLQIGVDEVMKSAENLLYRE